MRLALRRGRSRRWCWRVCGHPTSPLILCAAASGFFSWRLDPKSDIKTKARMSSGPNRDVTARQLCHVLLTGAHLGPAELTGRAAACTRGGHCRPAGGGTCPRSRRWNPGLSSTNVQAVAVIPGHRDPRVCFLAALLALSSLCGQKVLTQQKSDCRLLHTLSTVGSFHVTCTTKSRPCTWLAGPSPYVPDCLSGPPSPKPCARLCVGPRACDALCSIRAPTLWSPQTSPPYPVQPPHSVPSRGDSPLPAPATPRAPGGPGSASPPLWPAPPVAPPHTQVLRKHFLSVSFVQADDRVTECPGRKRREPPNRKKAG